MRRVAFFRILCLVFGAGKCRLVLRPRICSRIVNAIRRKSDVRRLVNVKRTQSIRTARWKARPKRRLPRSRLSKLYGPPID